MFEVSFSVLLLLIGAVVVILVVFVSWLNNRAAEGQLNYIESNFDPYNSIYLRTKQLEEKKAQLEQEIQTLKDEQGKQVERQKEVVTLKAELTDLESQILNRKDDWERVKSLTTEINLLQQRKDQIQQETLKLDAKHKELVAEVAEKETSLNKASETLHNAQSQLLEAQQNLRTLNEKHFAVDTEVQSYQQKLEALKLAVEKAQEEATTARAEEERLKTSVRSLEEKLDELKDKRNEIRIEEEEIAAQDELLRKRRMELQRLENDIIKAQSALAEANDTLEQKESLVSEATTAKHELASVQDANASLKREEARLLVQCASLKKELDDLQRQYEEKENLRGELEDLLQESNTRRAELRLLETQLEEKNAALQRNALNLQNLEENIKRAYEEMETAALTISEQDGLRQEVKAVQAELDKAHTTKAELQSEEQRLLARREDLKREIENFERLRDEAKNSVDFDKLREASGALNVPLATPVVETQSNEQLRANEAEELQESPSLVKNLKPVEVNSKKTQEADALFGFADALEDAGYIFHPRTLCSFHTALKCQNINPLTVLAGVSGTGKTLLPILYARYMNMLQLTISVQPRWDSPQDLFGFYNYLEHRYKATELSRLLYAYNKDPKLNDYMTIVLFDEMNLAKTEYYFSDILSKLELRRIGSKDAALSIDLSRQLKLQIPENLLMVGTMNEDESTQTLSDKVLDRANVLRFGKPTTVISLDFEKQNVQKGQKEFANSQEEVHVTKAVWETWRGSTSKAATVNIDAIKKWLQTINNAMDDLGRPFGYRVQEAILQYVWQYPEVYPNAYKLAFADQIEQKILPKLRGVDTMHTNYSQSIDTIQSVIAETADTELLNALEIAKSNALEQGQFIWMGVNRQDRNS